MKNQNLMTAETKKRLEDELKKANEDLTKSQLAIGEAAGRESDWHDNAAYDFAQVQFDLASTRVRTLAEKLHDTQIIEPKQTTDVVGIGNTVIVKFGGEEENEKFTILGPDDSATRKDWLSFESPLGEKLVGKKENDVISYEIQDGKQIVKVIKILPGEFSNEQGDS